MFTINDNGDKVRFSQGNLQYQASTDTWRFATNQYDYVGDDVDGNVYENSEKCNNENISSNYAGWIDLFGWGTSGYSHGATCYQPWNTDSNNGKYCAYGSSTNPGSNNVAGVIKIKENEIGRETQSHYIGSSVRLVAAY